MTASAIESWLVNRVAEALGVSPTDIDVREALASYGLDSVRAVSLSGDLEEWLDRRLSPTLVYDYPTIEALARHLAEPLPSASALEAPLTAPSEVPAASRDPIAIIGIGCRFPGASNPPAFWTLLRDGVDAIREVPADRWDLSEYYDPDPTAPGKMNTRWGGFLDRVDAFDPYAFGIAPREATRMDPQQRLLLEVVWEALDDAGLPPDRLTGTDAGVFIGISSNDYGHLQLRDPALADPHAGTGNALSIAANRISYLLDLRGPSMAVDTACSSSLVAVHLACQSIWNGEASMALAGGVNVLLSPAITVNFTKAGFMAPDGRCKTFDARADGYVRGEGAGVIVLKPLSRALADGDPVYAVIRGSAVNSDGRTNGLTAPSQRAQEAVLREAYRRAGVSPGRVRFVECHGTGTALGDPIEAKALGAVCADARTALVPCAIGSVKSNIGHLEAAAGIAGLIKVALALSHRAIPPTLHFSAPNPHIPFDALPLRVQQELEPIDDVEGAVVAGVSAFGFGGTNAHAVLESAPTGAHARVAVAADWAKPAEVLSGPFLVPLSAHSPDALRAIAGAWRDALRGPLGGANLRNVGYTAAIRRAHRDHRTAVTAATPAEAADALDAIATGRGAAAWTGGTRGRRPRVVFVCSGQGPQWWGMGRELMSSEPVFRDVIARCDALLREDVPWSLLEELAAEEQTSRLDRTEIAQPALVALQAALIALWRAWGVEPDAVVGHSVGEITAANTAGALSLADALTVAAHRGRIMQRAAGSGGMVAADVALDEARALAAEHPGRLWVAAINGPSAVVLAGDDEAIVAVEKSLKGRGVFARVLPGNYPFHTPRMEPHRHELVSALNGLRAAPSAIPVISTVTGRHSRPGDFDAAYWGRNIVEPVQFASAVETALAEGETVFVEIGPHPVLSAAIAQSTALTTTRSAVVASLRRQEPERGTMLRSLGVLYSAGVAVDWPGLYPTGHVVALPTYPWQRERLWHAPRFHAVTAHGPAPMWDDDASDDQDESLDDLLYEVTWDRTPDVTEDPTHVSAGGAWLILSDRGDLGAAVGAHLTHLGASCTVVAGDAAADPGQIVRAMSENAHTLHIVSLQALDAPMGVADASGTVSDALAGQCARLADLTRALPEDGRCAMRLWIVTRGAQRVTGSEKEIAVVGAGLWGWGRTMAAEDPDRWGGLVDLDPDGQQAPDAARALVHEVLAADGEDQVALRAGARYAARLRALRRNIPLRAWSLRPDASYLITGGLGALGLAVAGWLVDRGARRLVLLGRTPLPPRDAWTRLDAATGLGRRAAAVRALEAKGASVHVATVDVGDPAQLSAFVERFHGELWPPIRGVIHAAGIVRAQAIRAATAGEIEPIVRPKIAGACALDHVFGDGLDFCVYFSSLSATLSSPLLAGYAAANAALDGIAWDRLARGRAALSINWGRWRDAGMGHRGHENGGDAHDEGLSPVAGLRALGWALQHDIPHVVIAKQRWDRWRTADARSASRPYAAGLVDATPRRSRPERDLVRALPDRGALLEAPLADRIQGVETFLLDTIAGVLQIPAARVDAQQPLNAMGFDSMMAAQVKVGVERALGVDISIVHFLDGASIHALAVSVAEGLERDQPAATGADREEHAHPLSHAQRALWFVHQFAPHSAAYHVTLPARLRSEIDTDALHRAFQALVDRHAALRTTFPAPNGVPVQLVHARNPVHFTSEDVAGWSDDAILARATVDAHRPFDLAAGPVFRVTVYSRGSHDHVLLVSVHHIAYDAASLMVLLEELGVLYEAVRLGRAPALPAVRAQYTDYARWQNALLDGPEGERLWEYWRAQLAGPLPDLNLPFDRPRPAVQSFRGASRPWALDTALTGRLKNLAVTHGTTLYTVLLSAFQVLLHRYTGQTDIVIGTPMLGRSRAEFGAVVGCCINAVVLRADVRSDAPWTAVLRQTRRIVLEAIDHQEFPFSLLVDRLQPARDTSRAPLFTVMFNMLDAHHRDGAREGAFALAVAGAQIDVGGLPLEVLAIEHHAAMFDLLLNIVDGGETLVGSLQYSTDLFDAPTIDRLLANYRVLLQGIADAPSQQVATLPLLDEAERRTLLEEWNRTTQPYPRESTFAALFEAQVDRTPEAIAATCAGERITYDALNQCANRMAHRLVELGVGRDTVVGVLADRGLEFLATIIAIFKSGGAYLPLDPRHPPRRHAQILEQSRLGLALVSQAYEPTLKHALDAMAADARPRIETLETAFEAPFNVTNPQVARGSRDLAYAIFTSGSTGAPKGALVEQRGMINNLCAKIVDLGLTDRDVIAQTASQCFDISVWQLLTALVAGAQVRIYGDAVAQDPRALLDAADQDGATVLEIVPSLLRAMIDTLPAGAGRPQLRALRWMIPTGEALPPEVCRSWLTAYPAVPMMNAYGPAECADDVTHHPILNPPPDDAVRVPIGRPIANTRLYILDAQRQPVPIGATGELWVAGDGVGRGYLHDPEQTNEVFVPDPYGGDADARFYRTGDLARYRADGVIEFLGRVDHQVKVRGFRIELGEIEAALKHHAAVRDVVVVARDETPGRTRLVAYLVDGGETTDDDMHAFLKERLPDYMVPRAYVRLASLPLSPNGKIDRRALPAPGSDASDTAAYSAPRTDVERILTGIWAEVLGLERVGIHDNFFTIGGDSIQSIRVLVRAHQAGLSITPVQIFQHQTVAELALAARATEPSAARPATASDDGAERRAAGDALGRTVDEIVDVYPLTPTQRTMLAHTLRPSGERARPSADGVYLEQLRVGLEGDLDPDTLAAAWRWAVEQHAVLRTAFWRDGAGSPMQAVVGTVTAPWRYDDLRGLPDTERAARVTAYLEADRSAAFDFTRPPLARLALFRTGPHTYRLVLNVHHVLLDAWSGALLLLRVLGYYGARRWGQQPFPIETPRSFRDYVEWLHVQDMDEAAIFWQQTLAGARVPTLLGAETARTDGGRPRYGERAIDLPASTTRALQAVSRAHRITANTLVQGAWAVVLNRLSGNDDVVFGATSAGRPPGLAGVETMLGLLITTVPVRIGVDPAQPVLNWLRAIQARQTASRDHEHVGEDAIRAWIGLDGATPLFSTVVRFQNYPVDAALRRPIGQLRITDFGITDVWPYPLCLVVQPGDSMRVLLTFDRQVIGDDHAEHVLETFAHVLAGVVTHIDGSLSDVIAAGARA
jgi:amino acid adenylation domain-containing protein